MRQGFLLGDGAGVGKGRQLSGVFLENFLRGRKKAIWVSVSTDLAVDAARDLYDLGVLDCVPVYGLKDLPYSPLDEVTAEQRIKAMIGESKVKDTRKGQVARAPRDMAADYTRHRLRVHTARQ
jgi:hypothetical protein